MSQKHSNEDPLVLPESNLQPQGSLQSTTRWDRMGRITILASLTYMLLYIPYFFVQMYRISNGVQVSPLAIFPAHFVGLALNLASLVMTIRDLYLRSFPNPNTKLTWGILIIATGGIGWIVYIFKYALKPRSSNTA